MLQRLTIKIALASIVVSGFLLSSQTHASSVTIIDDTWVNWPGYTSSVGDELGSPKIDKLRVTVSDDNVLNKIELLWRPGSGTHTRIKFDSLFINSYDITTTNSNWDDWDYFIHDGGDEHTWTNGNLRDVVNGRVPDDGIWRVKSNYRYTTAKTSNLRQDNPNGIDAKSLKRRKDFSSHITWDSTNGILTYDLASYGIMSESGFFVAYSPYCANDLIGGYANPVPVPAAIWLFASGLVGLVSFRKRSAKSV